MHSLRICCCLLPFYKYRVSTPPENLASVPSGRRSVQFVCDLSVPEVHAGVVDYAGAAGWALSDWGCYFPSSLFSSHERFDGILAIVVQDPLCAWLKAQPCPVVRLLCSERDLPCPAIEPDCLAIGALAAEHLLTLGSPTFAFYRSCDTSETRRLWEGFSGALAAAARKAHFIDYAAAVQPQTGTVIPRVQRWMWLRDQLAALPRPLALFVEDDRYANDVIEAIAMLGWRVPEDVAVLGVDNRALILGKLPLSVSSVDSNLHGVGWTGAALLNRLMDGGAPPNSPILVKPESVVSRRSTATFVCDRPTVSAAVKFLRAHYHEVIHIADIARFAGLSTRSLQVFFKEEVGCTISEELARLRMEHATRLLRETDLKLESVAHESGLKSASYLCEVFRSAFHTTPTAYREAQRAMPGKQ